MALGGGVLGMLILNGEIPYGLGGPCCHCAQAEACAIAEFWFTKFEAWLTGWFINCEAWPVKLGGATTKAGGGTPIGDGRPWLKYGTCPKMGLGDMPECCTRNGGLWCWKGNGMGDWGGGIGDWGGRKWTGDLDRCGGGDGKNTGDGDMDCCGDAKFCWVGKCWGLFVPP